MFMYAYGYYILEPLPHLQILTNSLGSNVCHIIILVVN